MEQLIERIIQELYQVDVRVELTRPESDLGDYATSIALQLSKRLGQNPREIAEAIAAKIGETSEIQEAYVAGPGFINVRVNTDTLLRQVNSVLEPTRIDETIVIETNNPNPFKAMHIGHAFNAILADTIANLLDMSGAHVYRVSYHGDVGLHVGKSMYSLLRYCQGDITRLTAIPEAERNSFMSRMYSDASKAYKEDEAAKSEIDALTKQSFTREDELYAHIYELCKAWSFQAIDATVIRLGNKPIVERFLESDTDVRGVAIVKANVPKVFQESNGALIFKGSNYGSFDNAYVTSRGLGLYGARDLGLIQLKNEQYHPSKSYIVTAEEQKNYFKGVLAAAGLCMPELKDVTENLPHGTVKLTTGKMSSRDGDVIEIDWLFEQVAAAITARGGEPVDAVVSGALRYQFLKVRVGSDVVFDVSEAVSITGNSGPYLQYAHARACSILAKSDGQFVEEIDELEKKERTFLLKMSQINEVITRSVAELMPHHICSYLYELAQDFNRFYEHNRVIGDPREGTRLVLVRHYRDTLARGLAILGIVAPEKM